MLDTLFGIHSDALQLKARRMEILSTNIANADTPGFKAKDVDFRKVLGWQLGVGGLNATHARHWRGPGHAGWLHDKDGKTGKNTDYVVYHAYDRQANGAPTLRIAPVIWGDDGWPVAQY